MAALLEQIFWICLLEVSATDLITGYLCCDGYYRNAAAMAVIQSVDQVQIARSATAGAYRQASGEVSFRSRGKCCDFFMPRMYPLDLVLLADGVSDPVQRIAGDTVYVL